MSNISQFLGSGVFPVGGSIPMPALANQSSFTTSSNELYVNSTNPTIVPATSCNATLAATASDLIMTSTQTSLIPFQQAANVIASGWTNGLTNAGVTNAPSQSTKAFYVGSTYYYFSPSDLNGNTIGFISTTDQINYTPFSAITPCANLVIVDVFYYAANSTWYFLEINGNIISMTNLTTFAGLAEYFLPNLSVASGYVKIININSIWYVIGGSTTGTGYRVSSSTNLTTWVNVLENTSATAPAITICQGAGTGASTEILIGCGNDVTLKSTNNGTSFTATTATTGLAGAVIKHVFYSTRTGLYYLAVGSSASVATGAYVIVSTTGTLTTAAWTNYYTGVGTALSIATSPITVVDTGTNVGIVFTNTSNNHNFYYGASYNTVSGNIMTAAQIQQLQSQVSLQSCARSFWVNGYLVTVYSDITNNFTTGRGNQWLIYSSGAICTTSITTSLQFNSSLLYYSTPYPQWWLWSGVTYLSGSYYVGAGNPVYNSSALAISYAMFMFKINSSFTTFSCPYLAVTSAVVSSGTFSINTGTNLNVLCLTTGRLNSASTGINWTISTLYTSGLTINFTPVYSFSGTALTYVGNLPSSASSAGSAGTFNFTGGVLNTPVAQPSSPPTIPKWSSLYSSYVYACPSYAYDSSAGSYSAVVNTNTVLTGTPAALMSFACLATNKSAGVNSLDILSNGMVLATGWSDTVTYSTQIATGNAVVQLVSNISNAFANWEIVYGGSSYLVNMNYNGTVTTMNIWKLNINGPVELVLSNYNVTNISISVSTALNPNTLRRVISYNGSFYLADAAPANTTSRNSLMLTPSNGSFTVNQAYLYIGSDYGPTGLANTYTTMDTVTTVNSTPVPAVYIPAGVSGNFVKVR